MKMAFYFESAVLRGLRLVDEFLEQLFDFTVGELGVGIALSVRGRCFQAVLGDSVVRRACRTELAGLSPVEQPDWLGWLGDFLRFGFEFHRTGFDFRRFESRRYGVLIVDRRERRGRVNRRGRQRLEGTGTALDESFFRRWQLLAQ